MNNERNELELDLRELFGVLRKRILIIILTALIFAGGAGVYSFFIAEPVYESTARLYIQTQSTSITSLADIQVSESLAQDYVEFIKSRTLAREVKENLGLTISNKDLIDCIRVSNPPDTRILNISVRGKDPVQTKEIANEYAKVAQKQISAIMNVDEPALWEKAVVVNKPVKPEKSKNMMLAFIAGAFIAAIISIIAHMMSDSIKTPEDIETHLGLTTLASIPYEGERKKKDKKKRKVRRKKGSSK